MRTYILLFVLYIPLSLLHAQLHDNTWMFGYSNNPDTTDIYGIVEMKFTDGRMSLRQNNVIDVDFDGTNTSLSDSIGKLLFLSNGYHIFNGNNAIMEGGNAIMDGDEYGSVWPQYVVGIPWPDRENYYMVFYQEYSQIGNIDIGATGLHYAIIDMSQNNGSGKVVSVKNTILQDTLWLGHVVPIRHANGRDWWLLMNEFYTNRYYRILIDPNGAHIAGSQKVGLKVVQGLGQSVFSPDGRFFCSYQSVSQQLGAYLDIYDFDRCTGLLSNHRQQHDSIPKRGGVAISPNSRYLYQNYRIQTFQYDLWASDVLATKTLVAQWDGTYAPFAATFFSMQLAPDGKIYAAANCGCYVMHVIHDPDQPGMACQYEQHGIQLPTYNAFSIPTFPNYRLGPLDGSPCDTLGLDNRPIAWYRYAQDTLDPLQVAFHDLSYYEPESWSWDFGDGTSSTERHPTHHYDSADVYEVCLTVSNVNSSHTHCKTLYLGVSGVENPVLQSQIQLSPNPFRERFTVALSAELRSPVLRLYDALGREVLRQRLGYGVTEIEAGALAAGLYFYGVEAGGELVKAGKVLKW